MNDEQLKNYLEQNKKSGWVTILPEHTDDISDFLKPTLNITGLNLIHKSDDNEVNYSRFNEIMHSKWPNNCTIVCDYVSPKGVSQFAEALKVNRSLACLSLFCLDIGLDGAKSLAEALRGNDVLQIILLFNNRIGAEGVKSFADVLKANASIKWFVINDNIGDQGASDLGRALITNTHLISMDLNDNNIGVAGAKSLAEVLMTNPYLMMLHLTSNNIGAEGARSLGEALKFNCHLRVLSLKDNNIGDLGVSSLSEVLERKKSIIVSLDLSKNHVGEHGAQSLNKALQKNKLITNLDLSDNLIDLGTLDLIQKDIIERNQGFLKKFADYLIGNKNSTIKLNLKDLIFLKGCDKQILRKELGNDSFLVNEYLKSSFFAKNGLPLTKASKIIVRVEDKTGNFDSCILPVEIIDLIFLFTTPEDFLDNEVDVSGKGEL